MRLTYSTFTIVRTISVAALGLAAASALAGCSAIFHLDDYTTAADGGPGSEPAAQGYSGATGAANEDSGPEDGAASGADGADASAACKANADCNPPGAKSAAAVCVKSTGDCAPLLTPDCPTLYGDYLNDDAIVVGLILGGAGAGPDTTLQDSALLAAEEINAPVAGGGLPPLNPGGRSRPLVMVGCSASANVNRAARHLVEELHVPAIVGPTVAEDVVAVTQQISAKGGTLIMTPTAVASSISNLVDGDLTWRTVPSDNQRAQLVIDQIGDLETVLRTTRSLTSVKLGIVYASDASGQSAFDAISGKLILNGHFINDAANAANVLVDPYPAGDPVSQSAIASKYASTFKPDMVFITAAEQIQSVVVPLEQALTAARAAYHPYYVCTGSTKGQAFLDALASPTIPPDIRRRIRGIGVKPDTESLPVLSDFDSAFLARYGRRPNPYTTTGAYDAVYAIAYAIAATPDKPVSGGSVAHGLRSLGVGDSFSIGAKEAYYVMKTLSAGTSVSLRGTASTLQWDSSGDASGGTVEVWCIGSSGGALAFGSSGLTMDVKTQVVGGAYVQCQ